MTPQHGRDVTESFEDRTALVPRHAVLSPRLKQRARYGRYVPIIIAGALLYGLDQGTKAAVVSYMNGRGNTPLDLLGGKVSIDLTHNSGAAFGILPNQTFLFIAIAVAVVVGIVASSRRLAAGPLALRVALGLVLGGALGNLTDRLRLGYVVDFIDLHWWPVFNVADSSIVIGVLLLMFTLGTRGESA